MRGNRDLIKEQRRQEFFELWSTVRAEGVLKFGLKVTASYALFVFVPITVMDSFQYGIPNGKWLLTRFLTCVAAGAGLTAIQWWTHEGKYKNILIDNRLRAREKAIANEESETRSPIEPGGSATQ